MHLYRVFLTKLVDGARERWTASKIESQGLFLLWLLVSLYGCKNVQLFRAGDMLLGRA